MHWFRRDIWKAAMVLAGLLLLLMLMALIPLSAKAHGGTLGVAIAGTAQPTPTVDLTVSALAKEQLALQVEQLQNQLENQNNWFANNSTALIAAFTTLVVALFGIYQWAENRRDERRKETIAQDKELKDRRDEREKRAEERFQAVCIGLGGEREEAKAGAAIVLRTFLRPGYEQFYAQTFDLAVAHLRLPRTSQATGDAEVPLPLTTLRQALIVVFKEGFPLARNQVSGPSSRFVKGIEPLDATGIQLDNAYLREADLKQVRMPEASLRKANLKGVILSGADLFKVKLCEASLTGADLSNASLIRANLFKTWFRQADLSGADLTEADLTGANFNEANLSRAILYKVDLANVLSLKDADLRGVKGLSKEQKAACKAQGAIVDEDGTVSGSQLPVSPPMPEPRDKL